MQQESFRRTLILLLDGAFANDEPKLSSDIQLMYTQCPLVFRKYLHTSVPEELGSQDARIDHDGDIEPTEKHDSIRLWKSISSKEIQERFQLPVRFHKLPIDDPLGAHVRYAYDIDYQEQYVTNLTSFATKWYQKASFFVR